MGGVDRWKRLTRVMQEPQVVNVLWLSQIFLHDVDVQEKGGPVASTYDALDCGWVMGVVGFVSAGGARCWGVDIALDLGIDSGLE